MAPSPRKEEGVSSASALREDLAFVSVLLSFHFSQRAAGLSPGSQHNRRAALCRTLLLGLLFVFSFVFSFIPDSHDHSLPPTDTLTDVVDRGP